MELSIKMWKILKWSLEETLACLITLIKLALVEKGFSVSQSVVELGFDFRGGKIYN